MRRIFLVLFTVWMLATWLSAQSIADAAPTRIEQARFQCAYNLLTGQWDTRQATVLKRCVANPLEVKDMQAYAVEVFGERAKKVFYTPVDITQYKAVRALASFAEEQKWMRSHTVAERADAWRVKFADVAGRLTPEQLEFAVRVSSWLNDPVNHKKEGQALLKESVGLFDLALGREVFGKLGTHAAVCGKQAAGTYIAIEGKDCVCSVGSSWNWSCTDGCSSGGGSCSETSDGCGFLGFYTCNGGCHTGEIQ